MTKKTQVWKCSLCGNIIEVLHEGTGSLVCCKQSMDKKEEQNSDSTTEKHVPIIEATDSGIKVTVGSTLHPMDDKHYIEWIEVINDDHIQKKYLKPGDTPIVEFCLPFNKNLVAREYCNIHGHWTTKRKGGCCCHA